jgi:hypothetical protein
VSGLGDRPAPRGARSIGVDLASDRDELVSRSRLRREQRARADANSAAPEAVAAINPTGLLVSTPARSGPNNRPSTYQGGRHTIEWLRVPVAIPESRFTCFGYDPSMLRELPDWLAEAVAVDGIERAA